MASQPATSAVPGSARPGETLPGKAGTPYGADIAFTLGVPQFRWVSGSARQDWATGEAYGV